MALPLVIGLSATTVAVAPRAIADTAPAEGIVDTVSSDPLPTAQINGVVYTQSASATKVWVGGAFSSARPPGAAPGTNESPRSNLMAYNVETGALDSWAPTTDGRVMASDLSPDGTRLYVAGAFSKVNGLNRYRVAAFDTATGNLISNWTPSVNSTVFDIKATNTAVYVTGQFTNANNTARSRIAAFSATNGSLLPFAPVLSGGYGGRALAISPDKSKIVVAGSFLTTNGSDNPGRGMAALDATTGAVMPWGVNNVIRNAGNNSAIYSLGSDGDSVYGSGYDFGGTKDQDDFEGSFRASWSDGSMMWMEDCHGDSYSVFPMDGVLYQAGHAHYCGNIGEFPQTDPWTVRHSLAFDKQPSDRRITQDIYGYRSFTGQVAGKLLHWYPIWATGTVTGVDQAAWDITTNGKYLLYGGEFTGVNNVKSQGLVRFAKKTVAPNRQGPSLQGSFWPLTAISFRPGQARLSWQANYDSDNAELTYELFRRNVAAPLLTKKVSSTYWVRDLMTFTDTGLKSGQSYDYRVRATDAFGNTTTSDWKSVSVAAEGSEDSYANAVLADQPKSFWTLGEPDGPAAYDWAGGNDLNITGTATRGVVGPTGDNGLRATDFSGDNASAAATAAQPGPDTFSAEAWFKTTSTAGGKILGFGDRASGGTSNNYDRHIYLDGNGKVTFGVHPGGVRVVQSGPGFNDGQWHHVVGTLGASGQALYVDGKRVGSRSDTTSGQPFTGFWRVGGDNLGGWPDAGQPYLAGSISDVAIYDKVLTREQVNGHWVASGRPSVIPPAPADAYGKSVVALDPTLYWRLGDTSGTVATDSGADGSNGTYRGTVQQGQQGAISNLDNTSISLPQGETSGFVSSDRMYSNPTTYALETWFKTTTDRGGKLVGFGSSNTDPSGSYDRHIYMSPNGRLNFGVWTGYTNVITSDSAYNDGAWHHVVAQQSGAGMQMFVDGQSVGTNPQTSAQDYAGFWRAGGDNGWEGDQYWKGSLDEVAVYSQPLSPSTVQQHFDLGAFGGPNAAPNASFTASVSDLAVTFDAATSVDSDGTIASYAWDFGDGHVGSGIKPTHSYDTPGNYQVKLTVTDNRGATAVRTVAVEALAPNVLPTATFSSNVVNLRADFDATSSSDADGTVASYAWDFGDGKTGEGSTVEHVYPNPGSYSVTLTVTDDRGGKHSVQHSVTTTAPPANEPPTSRFTVSTADLKATFDASGSTDSDGSISAYAWKFGDGSTGDGAAATHTYDKAGTYRVELTVVDDGGLESTSTTSVQVTAPKTAPVADFTASVNDLTVAVDAGASSDVDGTIAGYTWAFGDGSQAQGATTSHVYQRAGAFTITLTVTDNDGLTASKTVPVTVTAPPPASMVLAKDDFARTVNGGWGTADIGGAWTALYGAAAFSVSDTAGQVALKPADTREARLTSVKQDSAVVGLRFASDVASVGGTVSVTLIGRQINSSVYSARARLEPKGLIRLYILRDEASLGTLVLPNTYTAGQMINVKVSVAGTGSTRIMGKLWVDGSVEPNWQLQANDTTAALQGAGFVGVRMANSSASTNPLTRLRIDRFTVTDIP
jgi:PKD repeat protein